MKRSLRMFGLCLLLGMLVACGPTPTPIRPRPPILISPTATPVSSTPILRPVAPTATPVMPTRGELLPLSVRNTWTYSKTVVKDVYYGMENIPVGEPEKAELTLARGKCSPGTYSETYTVVAPAWKVRVAPSPECQGRYEDVQEVFWYALPYGGKEAKAKFYEHIPYPRTRLSPQLKDATFDPPWYTHDFLVVWNILDGKVTLADLKIYKYEIYMTYPNAITSVVTPAGHFDECVETIETLEGQAWYGVQKTHRYFCYGIGLAREIQIDEKGEVTYSMELTSYKVNRP